MKSNFIQFGLIVQFFTFIIIYFYLKLRKSVKYSSVWFFYLTIILIGITVLVDNIFDIFIMELVR